MENASTLSSTNLLVISLEDLVCSRCLSSTQLLLQNEDPNECTISNTPNVASLNPLRNTQQWSLRMLNATKLASQLAQSFARYDANSSILGTSDALHGGLSNLKLSQVSVTLKLLPNQERIPSDQRPSLIGDREGCYDDVSGQEEKKSEVCRRTLASLDGVFPVSCNEEMSEDEDKKPAASTTSIQSAICQISANRNQLDGSYKKNSTSLDQNHLETRSVNHRFAAKGNHLVDEKEKTAHININGVQPARPLRGKQLSRQFKDSLSQHRKQNDPTISSISSSPDSCLSANIASENRNSWEGDRKTAANSKHQQSDFDHDSQSRSSFEEDRKIAAKPKSQQRDLDDVHQSRYSLEEDRKIAAKPKSQQIDLDDRKIAAKPNCQQSGLDHERQSRHSFEEDRNNAAKPKCQQSGLDQEGQTRHSFEENRKIAAEPKCQQSAHEFRPENCLSTISFDEDPKIRASDRNHQQHRAGQNGQSNRPVSDKILFGIASLDHNNKVAPSNSGGNRIRPPQQSPGTIDQMDISYSTSTNSNLNSGAERHIFNNTNTYRLESQPLTSQLQYFPTNSNLSDIEKFKSLSSSPANPVKWILANMTIILPIGISPIQSLYHDPTSQTSNHFSTFQKKLRLLGKLIFSVFSQGSDLPHEMMSNHSYPNTDFMDCFASVVSATPNSKVRRRGGGSLFSNLLETSDFPTSICRLLSDMIDIGLQGKADSPFTMFDDVIDDLQQIVKCPSTFLYNPANNIFQSNILFGQRYYGRHEELSKILEVTKRLENGNQSKRMTEVAFVSGIAGSGKSHLVRRVSELVAGPKWIVLEAKFERGTEHESKNVISGLFNRLVSNLLSMRSGNNEADVEYSMQVAHAITDTLDSISISRLSTFIPSIPELLPTASGYGVGRLDTEFSPRGLRYLLSKFLGAVLSLERHMMICLDNLQWADSAMLSLLGELITGAGYLWRGPGRFLVVATYRDNEISGFQSFKRQLQDLSHGSHVRLTEVNLSNMSKSDVTEMIMTELKMTRRLVLNLANIVHKKSSGNALFIVQFLNSLLSNSNISYSPQLRRYTWNQDVISAMKPGDDVAALIVSNLSSLSSAELQILRVISCFGTQAQVTLLEVLNGSPCLSTNLSTSLERMEERGIIERTSSIVSFSHDLIQEQVYRGIPALQRHQLHLDIGLYLGEAIDLDSRSSKYTVESSMGQLSISHNGDNSSSSIVAVAVGQINKSGMSFTADQSQRIRFASWNLVSGMESKMNSDFQAAAHFFKKGMQFLEGRLWREETHQLCRALNEGAASALLILGEKTEDIVKYASAVIEHSSSFEDSLESHYILLRWYESIGQHEKGLEKGLEALRKLDFDIPTPPVTHDHIVKAMTEISRMTSTFNFDENLHLQHHPDGKKKVILNIMDILLISTYRLSSPYMPLISCIFGKYSLQNGICAESAMAFMLFGYHKIFLEENYDEGQRWGNLAIKILDKSRPHRHLAMYRLCVLLFVNFWRVPFKKTSKLLKDAQEEGMKVGDVETAMLCLCFHWKYSIFQGEKLSSIMSAFDDNKKLVAKHNMECLKYASLDRALLNELSGQTNDPFSEFGAWGRERTIFDEFSLFSDATERQNTPLVEAVYLKRVISAFWRRQFSEAALWSSKVSSLASSKMPKIQLVVHTFYRSLISFVLYRERREDRYMDDGKHGLNKMKSWRVINDESIFENKLLLLQAEYHACLENPNDAKEAYDASITAARDHGCLPEQGLAYEFKGKFLAGIGENVEAKSCFENAFNCYTVWGAAAVAERVEKENKLEDRPNSSCDVATKHGRNW